MDKVLTSLTAKKVTSEFIGFGFRQNGVFSVVKGTRQRFCFTCCPKPQRRTLSRRLTDSNHLTSPAILLKELVVVVLAAGPAIAKAARVAILMIDDSREHQISVGDYGVLSFRTLAGNSVPRN